MRVFGVVCAIIPAASPAFAGNLVRDGGFEKPLAAVATSCGVADCAGFALGQRIGAWTVVGPGANSGGFPIIMLTGAYAEGALAFTPAQGKQALDLTGSFNQGLNGVQQTIPTVPGQAYVVSFAVGHADRAPYLADSLVQLDIDGAAVLTADNSDVTPNTINWQVFTYNFSATKRHTVIALFNATTASDYVGLDAVSVVATP